MLRPIWFCVARRTREFAPYLQPAPVVADIERKAMIEKEKICYLAAGRTPRRRARTGRAAPAASDPRATVTRPHAVVLPDLGARHAAASWTKVQKDRFQEMLHCGRLPYGQSRCAVSKRWSKSFEPWALSDSFAVQHKCLHEPRPRGRNVLRRSYQPCACRTLLHLQAWGGDEGHPGGTRCIVGLGQKRSLGTKGMIGLQLFAQDTSEFA